MKTSYLLVSLLASFKATAKPIGGSDFDIAPHSRVEQRAAVPAPPPPPPAPNPGPAPAPGPAKAADPPPAPTPLPPTLDGVVLDGGVVNYNPNNHNINNCWTVPVQRPPPSAPYAPGTCSVCGLQRNGTDGSADYQLWARDNLNNAMGNMSPTTVWPLDGMRSPADDSKNQSVIQMGGSPLQLWALEAEDPNYSMVYMRWVTPPHHLSAPLNDTTIPQVSFDPNPKMINTETCSSAGTALNGAVVYFICYFAC
ncbi:hypothetical protein HO133_003520 [Letharia lupina]|uniref:Uncharacterized protein n=1 Tax=Letharia lupina TaxID=560253 RepID=A0A8H6CBP4_9LECA|nr:uncharacterized protein HO133_003520 [Letharia lupina]KAF6220388.1 hypothetical protein HO133_003520 [Letharia lupina]